MSIAERLKDARLLYDQGRYEGALLSALVAAAATSRLRFPKGTKRDGDAFRDFLGAEIATVGQCPIEYNGKSHTYEEFFYEWVRCQLAHEGAMPSDIIFQTPAEPEAAVIKWGCSGPAQVIMDHTVIIMLAWIVASASENANVPAEIKNSLKPA